MSQEKQASEDKKPAKKLPPGKRRLVVQGVIVLALIYLGADHFLNEQVPTASEVVKKSPKSPIANIPSKPKKLKSEEVLPNPPGSDQSVPKEESPQLVQDEQDESSAPPPKEEELKEPPLEVKEPAVQEQQQPEQEQQVISSEVVEEELGEGKGEKPPEPSVPSWVVFWESIEIDQGVDYPPPADYGVKGRGLVYNCQARHWACVSRSTYVQCAQHQKKFASQTKNPNCIINQVYFSPTHCARGQLMHIHNRITPNDCGFK